MASRWRTQPGTARARLAGALVLAALVLVGWAVMRVEKEQPAGAGPALPSSTPLGEGRAVRNPVSIFLLKRNADEHEPASYMQWPRPSHGARGLEQRLGAALRELVRGTHEAEEAAGLVSAFSAATKDIVAKVEVRDGRAIVDFRDFRAEMPEVSTSAGGSIFLMQLSRTVFWFRGIESAELTIDGSCARFWNFLQGGGGCEILERPPQP